MNKSFRSKMNKLKQEARLRKEALIMARAQEEYELEYLQSYRRVMMSIRKLKKEARRERIIAQKV